MTSNGGTKELRKFGLTMFCALVVFGSVLVWRKRDTGFLLWGIGSAALLSGWIWPTILRPAYKYWMKMTLLLGLISSHIILLLLYYLVFTPIGLTMRACGKNPLILKTDVNIKSYWISRGERAFNRQRCEKMF
jgi:ABC-type uncharacterized transport system permease subunit